MAMKVRYEAETRCISVFVSRDASGVSVLGVTPSTLRAYRTDEVVWDLISNVDNVKVEVKNFTLTTKRLPPGAKPPKGGHTTTKKGARIKEKVETDTDIGNFKYEIWLDGVMAFDPVLQIRD
jgi:hypothetical protein